MIDKTTTKLAVALGTAVLALYELKSGHLNSDEQVALIDEVLKEINFADREFAVRFALAALVQEQAFEAENKTN